MTTAPMSAEMDGRFYADDEGVVWRAPRRTKTLDGSRITMGFRVCKVFDEIGQEGASVLAGVLNQALEKGIIDP